MIGSRHYNRQRRKREVEARVVRRREEEEGRGELLQPS